MPNELLFPEIPHSTGFLVTGQRRYRVKLCTCVYTSLSNCKWEVFTAVNTRQFIVGFFQSTGKIFTEELRELGKMAKQADSLVKRCTYAK